MFGGQVFTFAEQIANVWEFNLEIFSANGRIEIREIGFDGSAAIS